MESPSGTSNGTSEPLIGQGVVAVVVGLRAVRIRWSTLAMRGLVVAAVVLRGDSFAFERLIAVVRRPDLLVLGVAVGRRSPFTVQVVSLTRIWRLGRRLALVVCHESSTVDAATPVPAARARHLTV